MVIVGALGRRPCPVGGVDMMSGFRGHRKQGVCRDALLERQRDAQQQHVPRRKLEEECVRGTSQQRLCCIVLGTDWGEVKQCSAVNAIYCAGNTAHELEMRLRASKRVRSGE
jgi:hypothetical protein